MTPWMFGIDGLSVDEYAIAANAIVGIRDSGKTYTGTKAAEELYDAGVPFIVFDPIGKWHALRIPGKGVGYPVVVAGGKFADIPLSTANAVSIVRAAMEAGVSVVIDLFSPALSKSDWRKIVCACVNTLLHENDDWGLRHVFIEEAAEFVPQKPMDFDVFSAVEKMVRMGGNSKLGCTLINQRSADLNKSVLELCANVFVHRQKGKNTLLDLKKWFDLLDLPEGEDLRIAKALPNLKSGQCWALLNDVHAPVYFQVPAKNSKHPDRREKVGDVTTAAQKPRVEIGAFLTDLRSHLKDQEAATAASKPVEKSNTRSAAVISEEALAEAERRGFDHGLQEGEERGYRKGYAVALAAAQTAVNGLRVPGEDKPMPLHADQVGRSEFRQNLTAKVAAAPKQLAPAATKRSNNVDANGLDSAARKLLQAIESYPIRGLTWDEACIIAAMVPGNGYFYKGKKLLVDGGHVRQEEDGRVFPTAAGTTSAHMRRKDIVALWSKLKQPAPRMLEYLAEHPKRDVLVDELASAISAKPGNGYWYGGVAALRDANLIEDQKGALKLSSFLAEAK